MADRLVLRCALLAGLCFVVCAQPCALAQSAEDAPPIADADTPAVPEKVDIEPLAEDVEIEVRLVRILDATGWFEDPDVTVDEGVAFLSGRVDMQQHKDWAGKLAGNTQDVVAVVNQIEVTPKSVWDMSATWAELRQLGAEAVRSGPLLVIVLLMLVATWFLTKWSVLGASALMSRRLKNQLLRNVASRAVAVPVLLLGLYLVLKVSGLTRLAATVLGGTGLIGLILGFAFRDIAENFLASILISIRRPFATGDLVTVAGFQGFVQSVNTRSTLLMTLEGNHVQIPNATVYKETIVNFTANPNARFDFSVGIGYDDSISKAQSVAMTVLNDHQAVLADPESLVLVEALGASTVNLRVYFWVDVSKYSGLKVVSAIIRLTKTAFEEAGISMPDESREVVFPKGVPVQMASPDDAAPVEAVVPRRQAPESETDAHSAEGDLSSEAEDIQKQAKQSRPPEGGDNLLENNQ